jgi:BirA family transcriptional regulator, biotin operon repressor / biotin---[acetyl-CoA-carboxylase] ligase
VEDSLQPADVQPRLRGSYGRNAYVYVESTPSTQRLLDGRRHGSVAVAEHQTEGRGRRGREWVDVPGRSLLLSVVLEPERPPAAWPELTLIAARAVVAAVGEVAGLAAEIDPPNDVLVAGRKVAGILAEAGERVVLGIGINVGETAWPGSAALGEKVDRADLLVALLQALERGYETWAGGRVDDS